MLALNAGKLKAVAVPLGGGAAIRLRPATAFECEQAHASVVRMLAGLVAGQDSAARAAAALGEEFREADFTKPTWLDAAAKKLALLELVMLCHDGWSGICDADRKPIEKPEREHIALLLRDAVIAKLIETAIEARVHEEITEGKGLPVSPRGGAGEAAKPAPTAGPS